jgi:hypothetical protein
MAMWTSDMDEERAILQTCGCAPYVAGNPLLMLVLDFRAAHTHYKVETSTIYQIWESHHDHLC